MTKKDYFHLSIIVSLLICGCVMFFISCNKNKEWNNPYEYRLDAFLTIDPALICYKESASISLPFVSPLGIAVGPAGMIYVTGDEKLLVMKEDGELVYQLALGHSAYSLTVSARGIIYVGYADYIEKIDIKTKERNEWASLGEKALITSLSVGDNFLYVANAGEHAVLCYSKEGTLLKRITGEEKQKEPYFIIPSPYFDVAAASDDTFWIVNPGRHRLEHWSAAGDFIKQWGLPGGEIDKFCGCCNPAHITLLHGNDPERKNVSIVTAEKGIPRIKLYSSTGDFICVIASPNLFKTGTAGLDCATGINGKIYVLDPVKKLVRIFVKGADNGGK